jgi:ABC-2 type transport system permease protein
LTKAHHISIGGRSDYLVGLKDFVKGLSKVSLWWAFAVDEVQQRYRRSRLGLIWIVVSYIIFVAAISIFFGGFSRKDANEFVAHVAVNYAFFSFLIANVTDGCAVFRSNKTWLGSMPLPHSIYVLKSVARGLFVLGINMAVAILVLLSTGHLRSLISFHALPAFLVLLLNALLIQTYLGYVTARFRDFEHLMQSLTRVLFFMTPILWVRAEQPVGSLRRTIADMNPFTHAMEIFSAPMLGRMPDLVSWQIIGIITGVNMVLMISASYFAHRRLLYWI